MLKMISIRRRVRTTSGRTNWYWKMTSTAAATSAAGISDDMMNLLYAVEQSPTVTTTQIGQKQEEMDAHDENNSSKDIPFHYSNKICFLSNEDFDCMVAAKNEAETAIGWKLVPENIVYRVDKMCPIQTKWGSRCILHLRNAM